VSAERIAQRPRNSAIGGGVKKAPRALRKAAESTGLGDISVRLPRESDGNRRSIANFEGSVIGEIAVDDPREHVVLRARVRQANRTTARSLRRSSERATAKGRRHRVGSHEGGGAGSSVELGSELMLAARGQSLALHLLPFSFPLAPHLLPGAPVPPPHNRTNIWKQGQNVTISRFFGQPTQLASRTSTGDATKPKSPANRPYSEASSGSYENVKAIGANG
jgi:hypothetical protein